MACDKNRRLAAGSSTGGMTNKHPGRVGDTAIVGAGTYAEDGVCAVSCTGWGEVFLEKMAASRVALLMSETGRSLKEAVEKVIRQVLPKGSGGLIAVDLKGNIQMPFNTKAMARGKVSSDGKYKVDID